MDAGTWNARYASRPELEWGAGPNAWVATLGAQKGTPGGNRPGYLRACRRGSSTTTVVPVEPGDSIDNRPWCASTN